MSAPENNVVVFLLGMVVVASVVIGALVACLRAYWLRLRQQQEHLDFLGLHRDSFERGSTSFYDRPSRWLAIRTNDIAQVQEALGLCNPTPCSWSEGMGKMGDRKLFVSAPLDGWVLVVGQGLPDPADDIDRFFHFIMRLARSLGSVQFYCSNRVLNHHAWVRAENTHIYRAYVWAGETLWNEGDLTAAERDLGLRCFEYGEQPSVFPFSSREAHFANAEKVPMLAARWSLDPSAVHNLGYNPHSGISGDFSNR